MSGLGIRNVCFSIRKIGGVLQPPGFSFFPVLIHLCLFFVVGQVLEFIREGKSVAELMDLGKQLLGR